MRVAVLSILGLLVASPCSGPQASQTRNYLGFDVNTYPGDDALATLRQTFSFASYWLSVPPGAKDNNWISKRAVMRSHGFGFLVLSVGPPSRVLTSEAQASQRAVADAQNIASAAKKEGFAPGTIIFLDIEEGGRLAPAYHDYLRAWADELLRSGYRAGVYCSGIAFHEAGGATIITADDIRNHMGGRALAYWVYNDACPPAPGCVAKNPPAASASGVAYADVWQFAQSPRRKEFTAHCAATYNADGNCYAPGDAKHTWFLDLNTAKSADPSGGRK